MHNSRSWQTVEDTITQDMKTITKYLFNWRLKLSETKTVTSCFHLNNREVKREISVHLESIILKSTPHLKYLGVTLDRTLTYRQHLENLRKKLTSRVALLRGFARSSWRAVADTLRTGTLALVYSTDEYCVPAWCRSTHTRMIDKPINDALRILSGCLEPTPTANLPILSGIQPADLRRNETTLHLGRRALEPKHPLHSKVANAIEFRPRLKSRGPFGTHALQLMNSAKETNMSIAQ